MSTHFHSDHLKGFQYSNENNRLHFSVSNPDRALPKIIDVLSDANIPIHSIDSDRATLEDVFLGLTGKGINK